jgi:hypothetical protein
MTRTLGPLADPVSNSGIVNTGANQTSVTLTVFNSYAGSAGNWFGLDDLSFVEAGSTCIDGSVYPFGKPRRNSFAASWRWNSTLRRATTGSSG